MNFIKLQLILQVLKRFKYPIVIAFFLMTACYLLASGAFDIFIFSPPKNNKPPNSFRLVTYNIAHGRGRALNQLLVSKNEHQSILNFISKYLKRTNADIIAFQELDQDAFWSGSFNHLDEIQLELNFPYSHTANHNTKKSWWQMKYGVGILSQKKIAKEESIAFQEVALGGKGFQCVQVQIDDHSVNIINLHLSYKKEAERIEQLEVISQYIKKQKGLFIICGDFNLSWDSKPLQDLMAKFQLTTAFNETSPLVSFQTLYGYYQARIDFILASPGLKILQEEVGSINASDHLPLIADIVIE